eukprot:2652792-Rhodomonas_salina.1
MNYADWGLVDVRLRLRNRRIRHTPYICSPMPCSARASRASILRCIRIFAHSAEASGPAPFNLSRILRSIETRSLLHLGSILSQILGSRDRAHVIRLPLPFFLSPSLPRLAEARCDAMPCEHLRQKVEQRGAGREKRQRRRLQGQTLLTRMEFLVGGWKVAAKFTLGWRWNGLRLLRGCSWSVGKEGRGVGKVERSSESRGQGETRVGDDDVRALVGVLLAGTRKRRGSRGRRK